MAIAIVETVELARKRRVEWLDRAQPQVHFSVPVVYDPFGTSQTLSFTRTAPFSRSPRTTLTMFIDFHTTMFFADHKNYYWYALRNIHEAASHSGYNASHTIINEHAQSL